MMAQMAYSLKGVEPYQIGFKQSALYLVSQLSILPGVSPGRLPQILKGIVNMAAGFVLPERRQRHYPRAVKKEAATLCDTATFKSLTDKHYDKLSPFRSS